MTKAEIMINGPKGQAYAAVEVRDDGVIEASAGEQALAIALNIYNELEVHDGKSA